MNDDATSGVTQRIIGDAGEEITYTVGSGNVFADLGVEEPEEHLTKAQLVSRIADAIAARNLTRARAAQILGIPQPKVSALLRGDFTGFSLERLFCLLIALDNDIAIVVQPKSQEHGHVRVVRSPQQ